MLHNIVGTPARGDDFFGREDFVDFLWQRLDAGNVLLAAPRRFGKTSVMYRLIDEPREGWRVVHVDAEFIREPVGFVIALLEALTADEVVRRFLTKAWGRLGGWAKGLMEAAQVRADSWDVEFKIKFKEQIARHWEERGEALLGVLRDYHGKERLLIIIDELPVMLEHFRDSEVRDRDTRAFLYWFRGLRQDPEVGLGRCRFLVGGSVGIEPCLQRLKAGPAFNDFERVTLAALKEARAAELLGRLLGACGIKLSAATRKRMLELIGAPIPYFVQVFVVQVAAEAARGTERIGPKTVEDIYEEQVLGPASNTYFQHYYTRLSSYPEPDERAAKALLREMALAWPDPVSGPNLRGRHADVGGEKATDEAFAALLDRLANDFYIERVRGGGYRFASKVLCDWWRKHYAF